MTLQPPRAVHLLLVVLGLSLLWVGGSGTFSGPDTHVEQYTAYEVTHEDGEIVVTEVDSGEERKLSNSTLTVDENVVCMQSPTRECSLAWQEYNGEINSTGIRSTFNYAYFGGEFYELRSSADQRLQYQYERTDPEVAFERLALDGDQLTETEHEVLKEGTMISPEPVHRTNQLMESDGQYYTIAMTGNKHPSFCGGGSEFCEQAERVLWIDWVQGAVLGLLGLVGVLAGVIGMYREYRVD